MKQKTEVPDGCEFTLAFSTHSGLIEFRITLKGLN